MNIQQAAKKAHAQNKAIVRASWLQGGEAISIIPTDGPECCIVQLGDRTISRWEPQCEDLIADDWEVTE